MVPPTRPRVLLAHRLLLIGLTAGLVVGARLLLSDEVDRLFPRLVGWRRLLPALGWFATALAVLGLWRWRWWGLRLALVAAAYEFAVEAYGGGLGAHLMRLPVAAALLVFTCTRLRERFQDAPGRS